MITRRFLLQAAAAGDAYSRDFGRRGLKMLPGSDLPDHALQRRRLRLWRARPHASRPTSR
jgi:hypothetical protein